MRKLLFLLTIFVAITLAGCDKTGEHEIGMLSPTPTPESTPISEPTITVPSPTNDKIFSSMQESYYHKYTELADKYGTHIICDTANGSYPRRSYLGGVSIVNLMDFNGDGMQDLFVVYSNGQLEKMRYDGYALEIYEFPRRDTFEIEIWTYKNGTLEQLLHESFVSICGSYYFDSFIQYFITIYENDNGLPLIQLYSEEKISCEYTNIYYSDGEIVRDILKYENNIYMMNNSEITEEAWNKNIAGYHKIFLCAILADSWTPSSSLSESGVDYLSTLRQTERVIRYLHHQTEETPNFNVAEGEYIRLYLQELERNNRIRFDLEQGFSENHYYNLYDMNQDSLPELIYYESSSGAGTHSHFLTIANGSVVECGEFGRAGININSEGGLIAYYARMGGYWINKITLNGTEIEIMEIADGYIGEEETYPELDELGYKNYTYLEFCHPAVPFALYKYNQD